MTTNTPNFRLVCPNCGERIVVVWKQTAAPSSDFMFTNVRCQNQRCKWIGDLPASLGQFEE
jgi:hypothetical protein